MCMSKPKMPKMPEQKDPVLPKQALNQQAPVGLKVGRTEDTDEFKGVKAKRARGKLRIDVKDNTGAQIAGGGAAAPTSLK